MIALPHVRFDGVSKSFGATLALAPLDLGVRPGEFTVLIGPSGCGKTTSLRLLAGFEPPTSGRLFLGQRDITAVAPRDRNMAMVFQNYALYPHMSAAENMGFALRLQGLKPAEIDLRPAARQMLADIGHPFAKGEKVYDVTFENVQAGLRTDYLFRLANQHRGMVVGTGDLSELGLGWCTYGVGDHMSHYNPNGSVSKTLIQHLIRFVAASDDVDRETAAVLHDILDTEISPELIPPGEGGVIQSTEQSVGPYALQDFNLYYLTRLGYRPSKIAFLAWNAWHDVDKGAWPANVPAGSKRAFTLEEIRSWMTLFLRRFFTNQFKRSALPNGPKISSGGSLSPRGDWRAPSDGSPDVWLAELAGHVPEK